MNPFRDVHALVTGGSSGIGLATLRLLAARGSRVSVIALDDADLATLAAAPLPAAGLHLEAADVADRPALEAAVAACARAQGPVDLLITSAGITRPGYFEELPSHEFERQMAVDYFGTLYAIRAVVPSMIERRRGIIAAISSTAGILGVFGYSAYGPAKYAVRGLCEIIRVELKPHRIHVACVYPSDVDTPQLAFEEPLKPPELRAVSGTIKPIPPQKVAAAIIRGIEKRRPVIYAETKTRLVARIAGTAPGFTRLYMDVVVGRARRRRLRGS